MAMLGLGGVTAMETREFAVAVSEAAGVTRVPRVAVAEMTVWPLGSARTTAEKTALPEPSVVTVVWPRKVCPWTKPVGAAVLAKNWRVKVVLGVLLSVPVIVVDPPETTAEKMTGE